MKKKFIKKEKGFTLVELLVSIAIFSLVLVVIMGAIVSIMDANRKARSLSLIMNNLDLAIESMTRSIKTGDFESMQGDNEITIIDQYDKEVTYRFNSDESRLEKRVGDGNEFLPITSSEIEVQDFRIDAVQVSAGEQPRFIMRIKGIANVGPRINSEFNIQTTVSRRNLNID